MVLTESLLLLSIADYWFTTNSMHGLRNCINVQEVCVNKSQENICQRDGFLLNAVMSTTISVR